MSFDDLGPFSKGCFSLSESVIMSDGGLLRCQSEVAFINCEELFFASQAKSKGQSHRTECSTRAVASSQSTQHDASSVERRCRPSSSLKRVLSKEDPELQVGQRHLNSSRRYLGRSRGLWGPPDEVGGGED